MGAGNAAYTRDRSDTGRPWQLSAIATETWQLHFRSIDLVKPDSPLHMTCVDQRHTIS